MKIENLMDVVDGYVFAALFSHVANKILLSFQ